MKKEIDVEKIIKRVQTESDARLEKVLKRHTGALLKNILLIWKVEFGF